MGTFLVSRFNHCLILVIWHKESSPKRGYFLSSGKSEGSVVGGCHRVCTRTYHKSRWSQSAQQGETRTRGITRDICVLCRQGVQVTLT